jgi:tRNA-Thr(GGU) m(6)t(6)A37 methyltransferase TsaA
MNPTSVTFRPIGVIRSEHTSADATPIQPVYARDCPGQVEISPEFAAGLADIEGFSHLYLLYWLHRADPPQLRVKPYLQDLEHGIFATRAPCRPNPIGLSLVRLVRREGRVLYLAGVDVLDGTPLLDLKPYAPRYDTVENPRGGWTEEVNDATARRRGRRGYRDDAAGGSATPPFTKLP